VSLSNATLISVTAPPTPTAGGGESYASATAVGCECILDEPNFSTRRLIDDLALESTAVLYVELANYPAAPTTILVNGIVTVQLQGLASQQLRVDWVKVRPFGGVSHVQAFVREM
jgi:hypothetical protein